MNINIFKVLLIMAITSAASIGSAAALLDVQGAIFSDGDGNTAGTVGVVSGGTIAPGSIFVAGAGPLGGATAMQSASYEGDVAMAATYAATELTGDTAVTVSGQRGGMMNTLQTSNANTLFSGSVAVGDTNAAQATLITDATAGVASTIGTTGIGDIATVGSSMNSNGDGDMLTTQQTEAFSARIASMPIGGLTEAVQGTVTSEVDSAFSAASAGASNGAFDLATSGVISPSGVTASSATASGFFGLADAEAVP